MAAKQPTGPHARANMLERMFVDHPRSLGMSWAEHGAGAAKISAELIGAGFACLVHAIVPGCFTETAGRTIERLHDHIAERSGGGAEPNDWPNDEL